MRTLWNVLVLALAANFLLLAGGVGWLYQSGHLDRQRVVAIRQMLFPPPQPPKPTSQPAVATTRPILRLEDLLAEHSGRPATEQIEFIQRAFDAQMALLDRRHRELLDLQTKIDQAGAKLAQDRAALESSQSALLAQKQEAERLAADKGFQDSLQRYEAMAAKQVKAIFMDLDDPTIQRYLQAMEPRNAARIIKEFRTPAELQRIQKVLERMRLAQGSEPGGS